MLRGRAPATRGVQHGCETVRPDTRRGACESACGLSSSRAIRRQCSWIASSMPCPRARASARPFQSFCLAPLGISMPTRRALFRLTSLDSIALAWLSSGTRLAVKVAIRLDDRGDPVVRSTRQLEPFIAHLVAPLRRDKQTVSSWAPPGASPGGHQETGSRSKPLMLSPGRQRKPDSGTASRSRGIRSSRLRIAICPSRRARGAPRQ